jgi:hypothetical protein
LVLFASGGHCGLLLRPRVARWAGVVANI